MLKLLKNLINILSFKEKRKIIFLLVMILIMALLDVIGVASIMPFMTVLTNPELVETNSVLNILFKYSAILGVESKNDFLFFLGFLVFILLVFSISFKGTTMYFLYRFVAMTEYNIGKRLVESYLKQPYSWFLSRNSADLGKSVLSEASLVVTRGIQPAMNLITHVVLVIFLFTLLTFVNLNFTLIAGAVLGGLYFFLYRLVRKFVFRIGQERLELNKLRFTSVSEAFNATKDIKVGGFEQIYINRFSEPAKNFAKIVTYSHILTDIPRLVLEAVTIGGIVLFILYLMKQNSNFIDLIPILALYTYAGYRLMPSLQNIYSSIINLRFAGPAINALHADLSNSQQLSLNRDQSFIKFEKDVVLKNVCFKYQNSERTALKNISLNISANSIVGLVGTTGSGKTTTVDLILGLLEPQKGTLEVDGEIITKNNCRNWCRLIGYVPQQIYLSDDTIAANIAFGVDFKNIDLKKVEWAAKTANLDKFVINELPKKYQTKVGERGVKLSGGQRQRIGIARALYNEPKVLFLDEATNALDYTTEKEIIDLLYNINGLTIVIITHRLTTLKKCNNIILLDKGKIKKQGNFFDVVGNTDVSL